MRKSNWSGLGRKTVGGIITAVAILATSASNAAPYPERDFTFVVQGSAGGGSDIVARTIANIIEKKNLVPTKIMIENRPGGGGAVGYNFVAQRKANPYFLGTIGGSFFTTPLLGQSPVTYKDFTPIAAIAADPYVMAVKADSGLDTFDAIKAKKTIRVGTTGVVTDPGLLAGMLEKPLGITARTIPFGGDGEVLSAVLGGHIDVQFGNPSEVLSQVKAGKLKALAVTSGTRLEQLPDVPTFKELGFDIELTQLRGIVMPKDIPDEAVKFWEGVMKQVAESPEWKAEYVDRNNAVPVFLDSKAFGEAMPKYSDMYSEYMKKIKASQ
ncbi:Bug family tripartite tricarboxylate transporter substrate binding protein [Microvirga sp. P5_D2]